ncbi:PREDICTED: uncharacterized protein LOC104807329 [Tarenaya hassleriana]|uniref:uncharacterized protein LOC104807329 n=1 Tax=Tarenaya hassleriana TaxID=28532 RepID=UPI00053CA1BA|nr:PREDICTED: uncharacterized protein LOC104807329 [Tarenaya hassleriana]
MSKEGGSETTEHSRQQSGRTPPTPAPPPRPWRPYSQRFTAPTQEIYPSRPPFWPPQPPPIMSAQAAVYYNPMLSLSPYQDFRQPHPPAGYPVPYGASWFHTPGALPQYAAGVPFTDPGISSWFRPPAAPYMTGSSSRTLGTFWPRPQGALTESTTGLPLTAPGTGMFDNEGEGAFSDHVVEGALKSMGIEEFRITDDDVTKPDEPSSPLALPKEKRLSAFADIAGSPDPEQEPLADAELLEQEEEELVRFSASQKHGDSRLLSLYGKKDEHHQDPTE